MTMQQWDPNTYARHARSGAQLHPEEDAMGNNVPAPPLLTRQEVSERLKLSLVTIDRLRRRKELNCVKLGRSVRIPAESVTAYLLRNGVRS